MTDATFAGIWTRLEQLAATRPDAPAVIAPDVHLGFEKFFRLCRSYAARLKAEGIKPGDVVSVAAGDTIAGVSSVFALGGIGAIYVPFSPDFLQKSTMLSRIKAILRTPEAPSLPGRRELVIDNSWSPLFARDDGTKASFAPAADPDQVTWFLPSSGTTGRTKHVEITQDLLHRRLQVIAEDYGFAQTRLLQLFHPSTRAFMIRAVAALTSGNSLVEPGPLDFIAHAGVNLVCGSPQQVRLWIGDARIAPRLPKLQVSGAKLPEVLVARLLDSFDVVEDVYGSNETIKSHVNVYRRSDKGIGVSGKPGSGVRIVTAEGAPCPSSTVGYVRVRTDCMAHAYLDDPAASRAHFRDGWFYPGDLGLIGDTDVLTIVGRESDVVNVEGAKILLNDMEECLASVPGVDAASCFEHAGRDGQVRIAACLCLTGGEEVAAAARQACVNNFGVVAAPYAILVVASLERTADGLIRRGAARDLFDRSVSNTARMAATSRLYTFGEP